MSLAERLKQFDGSPTYATEKQLETWEKMWMALFERVIINKKRLPFRTDATTLTPEWIEEIILNALHLLTTDKQSRIESLQNEIEKLKNGEDSQSSSESMDKDEESDEDEEFDEAVEVMRSRWRAFFYSMADNDFGPYTFQKGNFRIQKPEHLVSNALHFLKKQTEFAVGRAKGFAKKAFNKLNLHWIPE